MRVFGLSLLLAALGRAALAGDVPAPTLDKKVLSLAGARRIAAAAQEAAKAKGVDVVIVVVDDAGYVLFLERMDGAQVASVNVGIGKARTAAIYRRPSKVFEDQIKNGRVAALALADATPLQGGIPVLFNGKVVGAIGVSGDSPQIDEDIAIAGARALEEPPEVDARAPRGQAPAGLAQPDAHGGLARLMAPALVDGRPRNDRSRPKIRLLTRAGPGQASE